MTQRTSLLIVLNLIALGIIGSVYAGSGMLENSAACNDPMLLQLGKHAGDTICLHYNLPKSMIQPKCTQFNFFGLSKDIWAGRTKKTFNYQLHPKQGIAIRCAFINPKHPEASITATVANIVQKGAQWEITNTPSIKFYPGNEEYGFKIHYNYGGFKYPFIFLEQM